MILKKLEIKIIVVSPAKQIKKALILIEKFRNKNNIPFNKLNLKFDNEDKDLGHYFYKSNIKSCTIFINPEQCYRQEMLGFKNHPDDLSLSSVTIHEFSHFLDDILNIEKQYKKMSFTKSKFYINVWSKYSKIEEIAEMISLFILNPYLLKLIDIERFEFLKNKMKLKTVLQCNTIGFFKIYKEWCPEAKKDIRERFHLIINEKKLEVKMRKYIPLKDIKKYANYR